MQSSIPNLRCMVWGLMISYRSRSVKSVVKISAAFFIGIICVAAWAQPAAAPIDRNAPLQVRALLEKGATVKIACFGDSVTGVYYHTGTRRAWCDLLGLALEKLYPRAQIEMIHAGMSGNDTSDGLRRMDRDVLQHSPQLVVAMFGLNDVRSQTPAAYRQNLETMVQRARDGGAEIILMTPNAAGPGDSVRPPARVAEYAEIMRDVARTLAVPVVDAYAKFAAVQSSDSANWQRLMSDEIHPNMRGHRIFAEEVARVISGQLVSIGPLPALKPGLPFVLARLQAHQPVRVIAMTPYDTLIGPALRARFPDAVVEVTPWQPDPNSIIAIEAQAKELGWQKFRRDDALARPDLVVIAVPSTARAPTPAQFYHSYYWTMNWSLSSGLKPGAEWDAWVLLPSVLGGAVGPEDVAIDIVRGQDIPWLARKPGDLRSAQDLLSAELESLLPDKMEAAKTNP